MMENAKDPYSLLVRTVETNRVWEAIQKLPDDFRAIILMREYRELSYQEIATLLDCPLGTVMSRLARARSKLGVLLTGIRYPSNQKNNRTNRKDRNRARLSSGGRREY
jgi:RNA polymerase sigma-70 factor (ECF subfamily)